MERNKLVEELRLEREREQQGKDIRAPDINFIPNPVHLTIMKEAKKNGGVYDRREVIQKIKSSPNHEKLIKQMILWNKINLNTLIDAGYMTKQDENIYNANPVAYEIKKNVFKPGKNHAKLLEKHKEGIIKSSDLKKEHEGKKPEEKKRQKKFVDGMLKKLTDNGYVRKVENGLFEITDMGYEFMAEVKMEAKKKSIPSMRDDKATVNRKKFAVTGFDRCVGEVIEDGKINEQLLNEHKRSDTIAKRIETFKKNNLIKDDGSVTDEGLKLLKQAREISKNDMLSVDKLTPKQLKLVKDMRIFLNLSKSQILQHVYGHDEKLADSDLEFLIKKHVIKKDDNFGIYIMDKVGIALSNDLFPGAVKYHTKLHSRTVEVEHDMLVYTAYQRWVKFIIERGGSIVDIKNDRQLRSEDTKKYGHMTGSYPDLRVLYQMPGSDKICKYDIEVDCGYDGKTIRDKIHGLTSASTSGNLGWYCKTLYQATKVANMLTKDTTKVSRMNVARKMTVYYMDKDGNLQTVRHRHWDK